jgi:hypothetical protein
MCSLTQTQTWEISVGREVIAAGRPPPPMHICMYVYAFMCNICVSMDVHVQDNERDVIEPVRPPCMYVCMYACMYIYLREYGCTCAGQ